MSGGAPDSSWISLRGLLQRSRSLRYCWPARGAQGRAQSASHLRTPFTRWRAGLFELLNQSWPSAAGGGIPRAERRIPRLPPPAAATARCSLPPQCGMPAPTLLGCTSCSPSTRPCLPSTSGYLAGSARCVCTGGWLGKEAPWLLGLTTTGGAVTLRHTPFPAPCVGTGAAHRRAAAGGGPPLLPGRV